MSEKLWDGPVEMFVWGTQEDGNPRFTIRDRVKKTLFHIDLESREYWQVKRMREQIIPLIVELINRNSEKEQPDENGNGSNVFLEGGKILSEVTANIPVIAKKKRGRPRKDGR